MGMPMDFGRSDDIPRIALNYIVRAHDKSKGGLVGIAAQGSGNIDGDNLIGTSPPLKEPRCGAFMELKSREKIPIPIY